MGVKCDIGTKPGGRLASRLNHLRDAVTYFQNMGMAGAIRVAEEVRIWIVCMLGLRSLLNDPVLMVSLK